MSSERMKDAEMLAQFIEEVRDKLMLPPGDRASELRDLWGEQRIESEFRNLAERVATQRQREAAAEAKQLRRKHAEPRREREALQAKLSKLQGELERAEQSPAQPQSEAGDKTHDELDGVCSFGSSPSGPGSSCWRSSPVRASNGR